MYRTYEKPTVQKFGTFRHLTRAGCVSIGDGKTFEGSGPSVGSEPRITDGTTDYCFTGGSR